MFEKGDSYAVGKLDDSTIYGFISRTLGKYGDRVSERDTVFLNEPERGSFSTRSYFSGGMNIEAVIIQKHHSEKTLKIHVRSSSYREGATFLEDFLSYITDPANVNRIKASLTK